MGILYRAVRRQSEEDGNTGNTGNTDTSGGAGLDVHAQIAIGVIVPVILLLGGLVYFIWRTERKRKNAKVESPDRNHPSRLQDFLRRKDAMRGSTLIRSPQSDHYRHEKEDMHELDDTGYMHGSMLTRSAQTEHDRHDREDMHELDDTGYMHELEDACSPIYENNLEKPLPTHPPRKDSAVTGDPNNTNGDLTTTSEPGRSAASSDYNRRSRNSTIVNASAPSLLSPPPPAVPPRSTRPTSFLGKFTNKRDTRASKAASFSRFSTPTDFTMMEPHSKRRQSAAPGIQDRQVEDAAQRKEMSLDSFSSGDITPPVSALEDSESHSMKHLSTQFGQSLTRSPSHQSYQPRVSRDISPAR